MKVIGINGSARKNGNTSLLIQKVFDELEVEGIETSMINLGPQSVNGCLACMKCFENQDGHCVQKKDKLNDWLDEMRTCDGIILGTPVYFADISGQLKCFLDRCGMVAIANGNLFKRKVGAGVVAVRRAGSVSAFLHLSGLPAARTLQPRGAARDSEYPGRGTGRNRRGVRDTVLRVDTGTHPLRDPHTGWP